MCSGVHWVYSVRRAKNKRIKSKPIVFNSRRPERCNNWCQKWDCRLREPSKRRSHWYPQPMSTTLQLMDLYFGERLTRLEMTFCHGNKKWNRDGERKKIFEAFAFKKNDMQQPLKSSSRTKKTLKKSWSNAWTKIKKIEAKILNRQRRPPSRSTSPVRREIVLDEDFQRNLRG